MKRNIDEISDKEVLAIFDRCMRSLDENRIAKREARRRADFEECVNFCKRAKNIK